MDDDYKSTEDMPLRSQSIVHGRDLFHVVLLYSPPVMLLCASPHSPLWSKEAEQDSVVPLQAEEEEADRV